MNIVAGSLCLAIDRTPIIDVRRCSCMLRPPVVMTMVISAFACWRGHGGVRSAHADVRARRVATHVAAATARVPRRLACAVGIPGALQLNRHPEPGRALA